MSEYPRIDDQTAAQITEWFISSNNQGISSRAMGFALLDREQQWSGGNHPLDPLDFNRCLLLLLQAPGARAHMHKVAEISDVWRRLVDHWYQIERLFVEEVGINWCKGSRAPATYQLIRALIEGES